MKQQRDEFKQKHEYWIDDLNVSKQEYPILNLLPKATFKLITDI